MNIAGIEIPSNDPVFLAVVLVIHIPLGLTCVIVGLAAMLSKKGARAAFDVRQDLFLVSFGAYSVGDVLVHRALGGKLSLVCSRDAVLRVGLVWTHRDAEALALLR